jgi:hypothetical protein
MELPSVLDPRALTTILTKFTSPSSVSNRELAAAIHHLAGYFAGVAIKDVAEADAFFEIHDGSEEALALAVAELEKGDPEVAGNPLITMLVIKFATLALKRWLENRNK